MRHLPSHRKPSGLLGDVEGEHLRADGAARPLRWPLTEPEGFTAVYRAESPRVLRFCARRVLDAETAVDLTAETFAQAFRARGRFRGSTDVEVRAWLLTIARREVGRYLKRGRLDARAVRRLGIQVPHAAPDELLDIERHADLPALRREVAEQLAGLAADQRDAVRLRVLEERPYSDVAAQLGVPEATARARVSRGLRSLSAAWDGAHPNGGLA